MMTVYDPSEFGVRIPLVAFTHIYLHDPDDLSACVSVSMPDKRVRWVRTPSPWGNSGAARQMALCTSTGDLHIFYATRDDWISWWVSTDKEENGVKSSSWWFGVLR